MMFSFIIPFIALYAGLEAKSDMFVSRPSPTFSAEMVCKVFDDFTPEQTNFCMKYPRVTAEIVNGIQTGLRECERQFAGHRWNCTSSYREFTSFGQKRAVQGTQEAAFLNAIVSAAVAHSVTSACAKNNITGCVCAESKRRRTTQEIWDSAGCTNNIAHGIDVSKRFLDGPSGLIRNKYELQVKHNREAGRQAVLRSVGQRCNCHGASGSCSSKTCWETLSSKFERVGRLLKNKYKDVIRVEPAYILSQEGNVPKTLILPDTRFVKPPIDKLVYLDRSPTYCDPIKDKGVAGTRGRVCDETSNESHGCGELCCGRGHNTIVFIAKKQCKCRFHWCCEVKCQTCKTRQEQTVCK
ncbi:protein Wnt-7b-like isoform X2 [Dendronephthya gigantea]|uniref:protein Wnt-7b-like isoform X2 n=1 Tax=Dendronephthya gigantea TaxID=151771 RepID=UPI00106C8EF2|nr:protein Wnt-7b-like isoform X2 [Dendronephthya gigantea]